MTAVELDHTQQSERPERAVAVRRFDTAIEAGDGRTISLRIAPFGEIATCADGLGGVAPGVPYQEELMPGLYDKQLKAANRILLNFEHQQGIAGVVGHGLELSKRSDGYYLDGRIHETPDGDKTLTLVREGVLHGASVESYWLKSVRTANGVVRRVKAHLEAVAICREGAYPSAVMVGLRDGTIPEEIIHDEELYPLPFDPELARRIEALGLYVPERLKTAHPALGTPDETGTPDVDTRRDDEDEDDEGGSK